DLAAGHEDRATAEAHLAQLETMGAESFTAERARYRRRARRLIAEGGSKSQLLSLLHENGRKLVAALATRSPWTVIVDECHHLLEVWGYLVGGILDELGPDTFLVALTAPPPVDLAPRQLALSDALLGPVTFEVPAPALVKEGELAPYQDLAYFTTPLPHEQ